MSALARILSEKGFSVSGSDNSQSDITRELSSKGIKIYSSQEERNITELCKKIFLPVRIVISSAISNTNKELSEATRKNLKILHRSEILSYLCNEKLSIVIGGSHGKTTTSSFIATILSLANYDPSAVIGGIVEHYKSNSYSGKGKYIVAEADESDGTITKLNAQIGLITNLELDHTNFYSDTNQLITTMKTFGNNCSKLIVNFDCKILREYFSNKISFSIRETNGINYAAIPIKCNGNMTIANYYENEKLIDQIKIPIPGLHNLSNLLGSIAACRLAGLEFREIYTCINKIKTPQRRFEFRGMWNGRYIVDDYAHHPTEIKATLSMAKLMIDSNIDPNKKNLKSIIPVFQPHRYTRTKDFCKEFAQALASSSKVILTPIYGAGEKPIAGISSKMLASEIKSLNPSIKIIIAADFQDLVEILIANSQKGDIILNMGAGDINKVWGLLNNFSNKIMKDKVA